MQVNHRIYFILFFGTGVTDGCDPPCELLELKFSPLQYKQMFLTSELSL